MRSSTTLHYQLNNFEQDKQVIEEQILVDLKNILLTLIPLVKKPDWFTSPRKVDITLEVVD